MDLNVIRECSERSHAGTISFGEVVKRLTAAGVERYYVDYSRKETCYYGADGAWTTIPLVPERPLTIADAFSAPGVGAAVRGAQEGRVKYQEFSRLVTTAGCCGYMVYMNRGQMVVYQGRGGETHIERFPGTKP